MRHKIIFSILLSMITFAGLAQKPNVIYIMTDQWRSTAFGYSGNPTVKTPNVDEFSKDAINFENAVSVSPVCTPHRAALMTGRYPTTTGMFVNDLYLPESELCMAEIFKSEGYRTGFYGKWHLDGHGRQNNVQPYRRQGFDHWKALECSHDYHEMSYYENEDFELKKWNGYSPFAIVKDASMHLEELSKNTDPFLLFISLATPHFPHHTAPESYKEMYPPDELILRKNVVGGKFPALRKELQGYYAHCTATDEAIGDLLDKIRSLGFYDNSIIIFSADHGEMMGSHGIRPKEKQMAWDEAIKVPFLVRYPGLPKGGGEVINAPINTPDVLPTMLGLAGIEIPSQIEGEDLSSVVKDPKRQQDRAALFMSVRPFATAMFTEYRGIRTSQYSYVKTPGRATMLFDNIADPYQMNNLINRPEARELQAKLDEDLTMELEKIGDENFKDGDYYMKKWGYDFEGRRSIPYTTTPGEVLRVYTPQKRK